MMHTDIESMSAAGLLVLFDYELLRSVPELSLNTYEPDNELLRFVPKLSLNPYIITYLPNFLADFIWILYNATIVFPFMLAENYSKRIRYIYVICRGTDAGIMGRHKAITEFVEAFVT